MEPIFFLKTIIIFRISKCNFESLDDVSLYSHDICQYNKEGRNEIMEQDASVGQTMPSLLRSFISEYKI